MMKQKCNKKHRIIVCGIAGLIIACVCALVLGGRNLKSRILAAEPTNNTAQEQMHPTSDETIPASSQTSLSVQEEPLVLPDLSEMAAKNKDMIGWIKIDGTPLDYPVMFTPEDEEKYLHRNFEGNFSIGGLPFMDTACSLNPRSDNLILYGHNMVNGTQFRTLTNYTQEDYWKQYPQIQLSSLYENETYDILAVFYDQVYRKSDTCFKFYQFINAETKEEFDEAIAYYKDHALYETGVTAEYGDSLITLVTCSYHVENGRLVVVAKKTN